jgi:hypothetical protein
MVGNLLGIRLHWNKLHISPAASSFCGLLSLIMLGYKHYFRNSSMQAIFRKCTALYVQTVQKVTVHVIYYLFMYFILAAFLWVHLIRVSTLTFVAELGVSPRLQVHLPWHL